MASKNMKKTNFSLLNPNSGAVYHESISLTNAQVSDEIIFPISRMYAISIIFTGDLKIEFTNDPPSVIQAAAATYDEWDKASGINLGVTGIKVTSNSGNITAKVTVKTGKG